MALDGVTRDQISFECIDILVISGTTTGPESGCITRRVYCRDFISSSIELQLLNTTKTDITLEKCSLITRSSYFKLESNVGVKIAPSEKENVIIWATEEGEVQTTELVITILKEDGEKEQVIRYLKFQSTGNDDEHDDSEYTHPQFNKGSERKHRVSFQGRCIPGKKPVTKYENRLQEEWKLPQPLIPHELMAIAQDVLSPSKKTFTPREQSLRDALLDSPNTSSYVTKFEMLLHMEEHQNRQDIMRYDMENANLHRGEDNLLYLKVPGLAEKRPSLLNGDRVLVKPLNSRGKAGDTAYEGYVHRVELDRVGLRFSRSLRDKHSSMKKYYVRFDFNRWKFQLMHRSLQSIMLRMDSSEILFPSTITTERIDGRKAVTVFNTLVENNKEQKTAVEMIASGETSKVFIIFGPPGTGKTITMVEAVHQLLKSDEKAHMLVCATSNNACDLLTTKLLKHPKPIAIFRLHARSRNWKDVCDDVKRVSNYENNKFHYPSKEELKKYRVLVTTLVTAGRIASASFPKDHFKYVFIDEAGQALEPETMIAIAGVMAEDGKIVMAGDPKQLGPVVRSSIASTHGLQMSFLERLMNTSSAHGKDEGSYHPSSVVKLLKNYRSHESIIKIPNENFYDEELQVCADKQMRNSMSRWKHLPEADFPMIFHGVQGEDRQESNSPSYFNWEEVGLVMKYVDKLLSDKDGVVTPEQIGVICPYRKQVKKIKEELKKIPEKLNYTEIKVGSVEEFQGQERLVIIISTVRSDTKHFQVDSKSNLGFLVNPKRLNVAITRAKALLIVIGNPRILSLDKHWRSLLKYCIDSGGYTGLKFDINDDRYKVDDDENSVEKPTPVGESDRSKIQ